MYINKINNPTKQDRILRYNLAQLSIKILIISIFIWTPHKTYPGQKDYIQIIDACHYSNIFGEMRNFRIFLPKSYNKDNPDKKFPVIYFLHGWDQRYFGNGVRKYSSYEKGNDNNGDNIAGFVSSHEVIVVKSDGYNKGKWEEYDRRPYNIGQLSSYRQFPIYYPELIEYIDANYHTIADRQHRGISGLSMGGFTASWIGGKYPHLFCAVGNFCGSPEFYVGPQTIPVLYRHLDMFDNYGGMKYRLNNGNEDFIRGYHADINRVWTQVMDNYEYQMYNADHSACGLSDMFLFIMNTFSQKLEKPSQWDHIDIYPAFPVWGYKIHTDRDVPGFTILKNVDENGFRCSVREFLPDGQELSFVNVSVTTAPIYKKNKVYIVNDINLSTSEVIQKQVRSDKHGRLKINIDGNLHEIGINEVKAKSELVVASFEIVNAGWATAGKIEELSLYVLNKGLEEAKNLNVVITSTKKGTEIIEGDANFPNIKINEIKGNQVPFEFRVISDSIEIVQFEVTIKEDNEILKSQKIEIPVKKEIGNLVEFMIADGKNVSVASAGISPATMVLGKGNGDGIANPGESIVVLVKDGGLWRRANLSFKDKYLNPFGIYQRDEDNWSKYDHVGASFKYTVPLISSDCPEGHKIEFIAEYWLPDYPHHIIKNGKSILSVSGQDSTPPILRWVQVTGDNKIIANLWDGAKISSVKTRFILKKDPSEFFDVELNDDGLGGDCVKGDRVFSIEIPHKGFGLYNVEIEATDSYGNIMEYKSQNTHVLH